MIQKTAKQFCFTLIFSLGQFLSVCSTHVLAFFKITEYAASGMIGRNYQL